MSRGLEVCHLSVLDEGDGGGSEVWKRIDIDKMKKGREERGEMERIS